MHRRAPLTCDDYLRALITLMIGGWLTLLMGYGLWNALRDDWSAPGLWRASYWLLGCAVGIGLTMFAEKTCRND
jgi:hypothetical protein